MVDTTEASTIIQNLQAEVAELKKTLINPDDLLSILPTLANSMQCSFDTFATLKSQMTSQDAQEAEPTLEEAEKARDALMYSIETIDRIESGSQRNKAALHFLDEIAQYTVAMEGRKSAILSQLPELDTLRDEIHHESEVLVSSEETLKMMIDSFATDSAAMRSYRNYVNDRVNLNASMTEVLPPQDFSTPWQKLGKDLGSAEDLQERHERLKKGLINSFNEESNLTEVLEMLEHLIAESLEGLQKANPDSAERPIGEVIARLVAKRDKVVATPEDGESTLLNHQIQLDKIKRLASLAGQLDQLKNTQLTPHTDEIKVEGQSMMKKKGRGGPVRAGRGAAKKAAGQIGATDIADIIRGMNDRLELAEAISREAAEKIAGHLPEKQAELEQLLAQSEAVRANKEKSPVQLVHDKSDVYAAHLAFIQGLLDAAGEPTKVRDGLTALAGKVDALTADTAATDKAFGDKLGTPVDAPAAEPEATAEEAAPDADADAPAAEPDVTTEEASADPTIASLVEKLNDQADKLQAREARLQAALDALPNVQGSTDANLARAEEIVQALQPGGKDASEELAARSKALREDPEATPAAKQELLDDMLNQAKESAQSAGQIGVVSGGLDVAMANAEKLLNSIASKDPEPINAMLDQSAAARKEADTGDPTEKLKARLELLSQMLSKATEIAAEATKDADKAHEELNRVLSRAEATAMNTAKSLTPDVVETTEKMVEKAKAARETPFGRGTDRTSQEALTQKAEAVRELNNFSYSALAAVYEQALDALEELADKLQARADKETADQIEDLKTAAMTAKAIQNPEHCQKAIEGFKEAIGKVVDDTTVALQTIQEKLNDNLLLGEQLTAAILEATKDETPKTEEELLQPEEEAAGTSNIPEAEEGKEEEVEAPAEDLHPAFQPENLEKVKAELHAFFWNKDSTRLPELFKQFDLNGDGNIDAGELHRVLNACFTDYISITEIERMVEEADADGNGSVDIEEFCQIMEAHSEAQDGKGWNRFHLFEDMGGSEGVGKLVDIIFTNSAADPLLASYFDGVDVKKLIAAAVVYLSSALGGPSPWTGRSLVEIHKNIGVTEEAVQRFANIAVNAALECGSSPEDAENLRKAILSMAPQVVGRTRENLNFRSQQIRENCHGNIVEQLSAKNVILNEHLDGALTETTQNLDALKQAVAANAHHENILTKQEENIKTLRTKCGMDPKNVGATQMQIPVAPYKRKQSVQAVMGSLNSTLDRGSQQESTLSQLIGELPDFRRGKEALETYMLQIAEEQKRFDVMSRGFGVDVPIHTPYKGAFPTGGKAFDILAEEIIAFSPKKNEQTKAIKPAIDNQLASLKQMKAANDGLNRDNRALKEQLESAKNEVDGLASDLSAYQEGAVDFERMLEEKDAIIDQMTDQIDDLEADKKDLTRYEHLYNSINDECAAANEKLREAEIALEDVRQELHGKEKENEKLQKQVEELAPYKDKARELEADNEKLKADVAALTSLQDESDSAAKALIDKLNAQIQAQAQTIRELEERIKELEDQINNDTEETNNEKQMRCLKRMTQIRKIWLGEALTIWKLYEKPKVDTENLEGDPVDFEEDLVEEIDIRDLEAAQQVLDIAKRTSLEQNGIMSLFNKQGAKNEKPMAYLNIFRFFEEMMDKKFEVDNQDLSDHRRPRTMTEFMMEHLNRMFGLKKLAIRHLSQIMPALNNMVNEKQQYGTLFARLLQIFHPSPIPHMLAMYITRARIVFNGVIEASNKERGIEAAPKGAATRQRSQTTHGRAAYELAACGGEALCYKVLDVIMKEFESDRRTLQLILRLCKPEAITEPDYILFKLCHRLSKLGKDADSIFNGIDQDNDNSIGREEFVSGIKTALEIPISGLDLGKAFDYIDADETGQISREEFLREINFTVFQGKQKHANYIVTKSQYLNAIVDAFIAQQRHDAAKVIQMFTERFPSGTCDYDTALATVRELEPEIGAGKLANVTKEFEGKDTVSQDEFVGAVLEHAVNTYGAGIFYIPEVESATEERKVESTEVEIRASTGGVRVQTRQTSQTVTSTTTTSTTVTKKLVKKSTKTG